MSCKVYTSSGKCAGEREGSPPSVATRGGVAGTRGPCACRCSPNGKTAWGALTVKRPGERDKRKAPAKTSAPPLVATDTPTSYQKWLARTPENEIEHLDTIKLLDRFQQRLILPASYKQEVRS
jgi:hypothetical protein